MRTFVGHTFWIWGVGFSPDGKYVLTASQDRTARLWDAATGKQLRLFPSHANAAIASAIFTPDGRSVVIGSFDGVAQQTPVVLDDLIQSVCGRLLRDLTDEERTIYDFAFYGVQMWPATAKPSSSWPDYSGCRTDARMPGGIAVDVYPAAPASALA